MVVCNRQIETTTLSFIPPAAVPLELLIVLCSFCLMPLGKQSFQTEVSFEGFLERHHSDFRVGRTQTKLVTRLLSVHVFN